MLVMAILACTDCYNSDPRNPLCLPEPKKDIHIPPLSFKFTLDLNPDKICPHIATSCTFCWQRIFNAFLNITIWGSVFWLSFIGIEAIFLAFPAFAPVFKWLIPAFVVLTS